MTFLRQRLAQIMIDIVAENIREMTQMFKRLMP